MSALSAVIGLSLLLFVKTQHSPCPNTFQYRNDGGGTYGYVEVQPYGQVNTITTKVNFTIAAVLPSQYVGKLELARSIHEITYNRGSPIAYRVHFPVTSPLPRLTSLAVNDQILCYGPGDIPGPGGYVSTISLQHTLFFKDGYQGGYNHGGIDPGNINQDEFDYNIQRPTTEHNKNNLYNYITDDNVQVFMVGDDNRNSDFDFFQSDRRTERPVYNEYQTTRPPPPRVPAPTLPPTPPTNQSPPSQPSADTCGVQSSMEVPLIFNGETYERGEWPWLVAVYRRSDGGLNFICSGSLVSERHVVTAAHCMHKKTVLTSTRDIVVKVGAYNLEDWGDDITVTTTIASAAIHQNYNPKTLANDILVMTLSRSVAYNNYIRPLCLWRGNTDLERIVGTSGVVAGWGKSELGPGGRGVPRAARVPIVSTSTCRASKPDFHKLTSANTLCAGDRSGSGPCLGDSGTGLYVLENNRWQLRGVVSLSLRPENGDSSCNLNEYIVFTDTAQYLPWIKSVMAN